MTNFRSKLEEELEGCLHDPECFVNSTPAVADETIAETNKEVIDNILSLIEELIGEEEEGVSIEPEKTFTQRIAKAKYQNDLRKELKGKLHEI